MTQLGKRQPSTSPGPDASTLDDVTSAGRGGTRHHRHRSSTLDDVTSAGSAELMILGDGNVLLEDVTSDGTGFSVAPGAVVGFGSVAHARVRALCVGVGFISNPPPRRRRPSQKASRGAQSAVLRAQYTSRGGRQGRGKTRTTGREVGKVSMSYPVLIIPEGVESSDGRSYAAGVLSWRETIPLMFTDATSERHERSLPSRSHLQRPPADLRRGRPGSSEISPTTSTPKPPKPNVSQSRIRSPECPRMWLRSSRRPAN